MAAAATRQARRRSSTYFTTCHSTPKLARQNTTHNSYPLRLKEPLNNEALFCCLLLTHLLEGVLQPNRVASQDHWEACVRVNAWQGTDFPMNH